MKLTLRKARKLESSLSKVKVDRKKTLVNVRKVLDLKLPDLSLLLNEATETSLNSFEKGLNLIELRYKIRELISASNHKSGINKVMAKRAKLQCILEVIEDRLHSAFNLSVEDLLYMAKKEGDKSGVSSYSMSDKIKEFEVPSLNNTSDLYKELLDKRLDIKSEIDTLEDNLMSLNSTQTIQLNDEDEALLKELLIIR